MNAPQPVFPQARQAAEAALQEQRGNEARERAALRTILDSKMRNLLSDLSRGLAELPPGVRAVSPLLNCSDAGATVCCMEPQRHVSDAQLRLMPANVQCFTCTWCIAAAVRSSGLYGGSTGARI